MGFFFFLPQMTCSHHEELCSTFFFLISFSKKAFRRSIYKEPSCRRYGEGKGGKKPCKSNFFFSSFLSLLRKQRGVGTSRSG